MKQTTPIPIIAPIHEYTMTNTYSVDNFPQVWAEIHCTFASCSFDSSEKMVYGNYILLLAGCCA